jgi:hypothetical protein
MAGSTPNLIIDTSIYWGYFMVSSQEVSTMALAISFMKNSKPLCFSVFFWYFGFVLA